MLFGCKVRQLKRKAQVGIFRMVTDDPNIHYIEKNFSVQRDEDVITNVRNRVAAYEDSIRRHYEMVEMAAYKDSVATKLLEESKDIKRILENRN